MRRFVKYGFAVAGAIGAALTTACGSGSSAGGGGSTDAQVPDGGLGGDGNIEAGGPGASGILSMTSCAVANNGSCVTPLTRTRDDVCNRYKATQIDPSVNVFTSGTATCDPGTTATSAIDATIARINYFRWLVGVSPIAHAAAADSASLSCAVVTAHRSDLSNAQIDLHHPPSTTPCFTQAGADAALLSLVAPGVDHPATGIDLMMYDYGPRNDGALGHRRTLTASLLTATGVGYSRNVASGTGAMCAEYTPYGNFAPQSALDGMTIYPSPGPFPWDVTAISGVSEPMAWSFVLPSVIALSGAQVSMYLETSGAPKSLVITSGPASDDPPNRATLWITPQSNPPAGSSIVVEISNIPIGSIGYRVILEDCGTVARPQLDASTDGPTTPCSVLDQDCANAKDACHLNASGDPFNGSCIPAGFATQGMACASNASCVAGTDCVPPSSGSGPSVCSAFCDFGDPSPTHPCSTLCPGGYVTVYGLVAPDGGILGGIGRCPN
jgi:hypothetical protein